MRALAVLILMSLTLPSLPVYGVDSCSAIFGRESSRAVLIDRGLRAVDQCGDTCFFEAAVASLEIEINKPSGKGLRILRDELLGQYALNEIDRLSGEPSVERILISDRHFGDDYLEIFANGGKSTEVINFVNQSGIPVVESELTLDVLSEDARVHDLLSKLDSYYADFVKRIREFKTRHHPIESQDRLQIANLRAELKTRAKEAVDRSSRPHSLLEFKSSRLRTILSTQGHRDRDEIKRAIDIIKQSIDAGKPLVIGYFHREAGEESFKHEALVVGYHLSASGKISSVVILNSWGSEFGANGRFSLSTENLEDDLMFLAGFEEQAVSQSRRRR